MQILGDKQPGSSQSNEEDDDDDEGEEDVGEAREGHHGAVEGSAGAAGVAAAASSASEATASLTQPPRNGEEEGRDGQSKPLRVGRKRKAPRSFTSSFAKVVLSDPTLSVFANDIGLLHNGELVDIKGETEGGDSAVVDSMADIKTLARETLSVAQAKKNTTFTELAEAVLDRVFPGAPATERTVEERRLARRRVYDVVNVLVSLGVVMKQKGKKIQWFGVPYGSPSEVEYQAHELQELRERIAAKEQRIRDLLVHQLALHNLQHGQRESIAESMTDAERLFLPFVVMTTPASGTIDCEISDDHSQVCLTFSMPFEMRDDHEVLRLLRLHDVSESIVRQVVPPELFSYLPVSMQPTRREPAPRTATATATTTTASTT